MPLPYPLPRPVSPNSVPRMQDNPLNAPLSPSVDQPPIIPLPDLPSPSPPTDTSSRPIYDPFTQTYQYRPFSPLHFPTDCPACPFEPCNTLTTFPKPLPTHPTKPQPRTPEEEARIEERNEAQIAAVEASGIWRRPHRSAPKPRSVAERARVLREYEEVERAIAFSKEAETQTAAPVSAPSSCSSGGAARPPPAEGVERRPIAAAAAPVSAKTGRNAWSPMPRGPVEPPASTQETAGPSESRTRAIARPSPATIPSLLGSGARLTIPSLMSLNVRDPRDGRAEPPVLTVPPTPTGCWNCRDPGHTYAKCPRPRERRFCYRCGREGRDVHSCPFCPERDPQRPSSVGRGRGLARREAIGPVAPVVPGPAQAISPITTQPGAANMGGNPVLVVMPGATVYWGSPPNTPQ